MLYSSLRTIEDYKQLILKLAALTTKEDSKIYLKEQLAVFYQNRANAEDDVIKYSIRTLIAFFIYMVLINTKVEEVSIGVLHFKDISALQVYFPIVVQYYSLLMATSDLNRMRNLLMHYSIQGVLYPNILTGDLSDIFSPFSLLNVLIQSPIKSGLFKVVNFLAYFVIMGFGTFCGFVAYFYAFKNGLKGASTFFFYSSLIVQTALIILTLSVFIRKAKVEQLTKLSSAEKLV